MKDLEYNGQAIKDMSEDEFRLRVAMALAVQTAELLAIKDMLMRDVARRNNASFEALEKEVLENQQIFVTRYLADFPEKIHAIW